MDIFEHAYPIANVSPRLELVWRQIEFTRNYTLTLLDDLTDEDWFWSPAEMPTHIAWQVGHIAMSQYGLTLFRQRGRGEVDLDLMSSSFRKLFMRGTIPKTDSVLYPPPAEIVAVLNRVHQQMRIEFQEFADQELDTPLDPPHAAYANRYGALLFAPCHEMIHAGQIGLLRRLMGKEPLR